MFDVVVNHVLPQGASSPANCKSARASVALAQSRVVLVPRRGVVPLSLSGLSVIAVSVDHHQAVAAARRRMRALAALACSVLVEVHCLPQKRSRDDERVVEGDRRCVEHNGHSGANVVLVDRRDDVLEVQPVHLMNLTNERRDVVSVDVGGCEESRGCLSLDRAEGELMLFYLDCLHYFLSVVEEWDKEHLTIIRQPSQYHNISTNILG